MEYPNIKDPVLCYIDGSWAYFTPLALKDQWGDDWGDKPFEHNSGAPYTDVWDDTLCVDVPHKITKVGFDTDLVTPDYNHLNSPYSVEDINNEDIPWLRSRHPLACGIILIWAGTPVSDFVRLIKLAGGTAYVEA